MWGMHNRLARGLITAVLVQFTAVAPGRAISPERTVDITVGEFKQIQYHDRFDALELTLDAISGIYAANGSPDRARCMRELSDPTFGGTPALMRRILDRLDFALDSARVFDVAVIVVEQTCSE